MKNSFLFTLIAQLKIYFSSAGIYMAIANFIMILANFKLNYNINISSYILVPIGIICALFVGYIDYKLIYLKQNTYANKRNDLKIQLNRIEQLLKDGNKNEY